MSGRLELRGVAEMKGRLAALARAVPAAVPGALYRQAEKVMLDSQPEVPVDTGALRSSGFVEMPTQQGGTTTVRLGYGGAAADYALYVHEDLEAHHPTGSAKFLERPLLASVPNMGSAIAEDLADVLKANV